MRLSAVDLTSVAMEAPESPMHVGAILILAGRPAPQSLRPGPKLRRKLYRGCWVEDHAFRLENHVTEVALEPPAGEAELLRLAERLIATPLERSRPLWHLWVVTGLPRGRAALIVLLHHALADGTAAIRLIGELLDPSMPPVPPPNRPLPSPSVPGAWRTLRQAWAAPRTSLNAPVRAGRRLGVTRMDLAEARAVAHAAGGKANDVILAVIIGGLHDLLRARGEPVAGVDLRVAVAVSLRKPGEESTGGNRNGSVVVRLALSDASPAERLRAVVAETNRAKRGQAAAAQPRLMVLAARTGLARRLARGQRLVNLVESDVTGPPAPVRACGVPVLDLIPLGAIAGNLMVAFVALSYAGRLAVTVVADRDRFPDLPVLLAGMEREWSALAPRTQPAHSFPTHSCSQVTGSGGFPWD
ncbi:wax ester/triacylglycerol synthase domain-containing protein [Dactylosporangium sp. CA-233914]|uniref:wax ester/triacylglycerol synthase domain-containing protein n=1 Tax=Dactylosporangium sp. CA-233914 TaxID=3239934 RepID=UPI003D92F9E7